MTHPFMFACCLGFAFFELWCLCNYRYLARLRIKVEYLPDNRSARQAAIWLAPKSFIGFLYLLWTLLCLTYEPFVFTAAGLICLKSVSTMARSVCDKQTWVKVICWDNTFSMLFLLYPWTRTA